MRDRCRDGDARTCTQETTTVDRTGTKIGLILLVAHEGSHEIVAASSHRRTDEIR